MTKPTETKFNFTEAAIARLSFADHGQRYIVRDGSTKNFILRVGEKAKLYYLLKKINGRVVYVRLGDASNTSLKDAYELLDEHMKVVRKGKNPNVEKKKLRDDTTIKDFFENFYMPNHSELYKKTSSQREDKTCYCLYLKDIHGRKMLDVERHDVERLQRKLKEKHGLYAANHAMRLVRQMYNKAIDWGFPGTNPATRIRLFKEVRRDRFLQSDELPRLFEALATEPNAMFRNFVILSLFIGQRRKNMMAIKWSDVSFERRVIYMSETKTGKPQIAPIPDQVIDMLREMETFKNSEWLFPSAKSASGHLETPTKMWKTLLERAGIENLRIHDLRRTFASYQAMTGSSNAIIGDALGDKTPSVISTYARVAEEPVRISVQNAANAMFALMAPKEQGAK